MTMFMSKSKLSINYHGYVHEKTRAEDKLPCLCSWGNQGRV